MKHPYYPKGLLIPHYTPQNIPMEHILGVFFSLLLAILLLFTWRFSSRVKSGNNSSVFVYLWFILCGFIHTFVEGYFVVRNKTIAGESTFLANLWKEYAKSDSRYMTSDSTVLVIEAITCFLWGPLCFATAWASFHNSHWKHLLQFMISLGQLYGDVVYYSSTLLNGAPDCIPHPYYFWFYFVFMNSLWIVFPLLILFSSGRALLNACQTSKESPTRSLRSTPRRVKKE